MNGSDVSTTPGAAELAFVDGLEALPAEARALFAGPAEFYATEGWYRTLIATALPAGAVACFALLRIGPAMVALFPLLRHADGGLQSLTTPYSCLYRPLLANGLDAAALRLVGRTLARHVPGLRLEALALDMPGLSELERGFRAGGKWVLSFEHFGNWHEDVTGQDWPAYLAGRTSALRQTIRRRTARLLANPAISLRLLVEPADIEPGIAAFEAIYRRSWKQPEPYPEFNAGCIRLAAAQGVLQLALLCEAETPVAVQLWVVTAGCAQVLKLAHDEAFRAMSPGTVLTAWAIRRFFEDDSITAIDFGRGDDAYKQGWASQRRSRVGLLLVSPRTPAGLRLYARHGLGRAWRKIQKFITDINAIRGKAG